MVIYKKTYNWIHKEQDSKVQYSRKILQIFFHLVSKIFFNKVYPIIRNDSALSFSFSFFLQKKQFDDYNTSRNYY